MAKHRPLNAIASRLGTMNAVRALRHGDYARYLTTAWVTMVGNWLRRIGMGWLTWELTHSGAWLGAVALGGSLPAILLVPFAGAIGDRMDRVRLLRLAHWGQIAVSSALIAETVPDPIGVG